MNSAKAILSAVFAGLTALVADLRGADADLTFRDWIVIVLAALIAGVGTYLIPPGPGLRTPPAPPRGQHGYIGEGVGLIVVGLVAIVLGAWVDFALVVWLGVIAVGAGIVLAVLRR